jgi:hypothetical protein
MYFLSNYAPYGASAPSVTLLGIKLLGTVLHNTASLHCYPRFLRSSTTVHYWMQHQLLVHAKCYAVLHLLQIDRVNSASLPITSHIITLNPSFHTNNSVTILRNELGRFSGQITVNVTTLRTGWHRIFALAKQLDPRTNATQVSAQRCSTALPALQLAECRASTDSCSIYWFASCIAGRTMARTASLSPHHLPTMRAFCRHLHSMKAGASKSCMHCPKLP